MKCKKHPTDLSSSVGVCASCLRERLVAIIAAQAQAAARAQQQNHRKLETQQTAPLSFPRSSSPYITQRKSDTAAAAAAAWQFHGGGGVQPRFFSTPLVGPTGKVSVEIKKKKNKSIFSSLFSGLFSRSKSGKSDLDPGPISYPGVPIDSCSATTSWFSAGVPDRRKKTRTFSIDETTIGAQRKPCRNRDRGMSPARCTDDEDEHCHGGSSGYSSESSQGWRQTPQRTPAATRRGGGRAPAHSKTVSSLNFCLSPLVRAPANQKGMPPDMMVAGESRVPPKSPHLSTATSFCKNRSRKLADFGRHSYNPTH